jgi:hypothetical protein
MQPNLNHILNDCWEISLVLPGYSPFTPHYNSLFIPSLVYPQVGSGPIVKRFFGGPMLFER